MKNINWKYALGEIVIVIIGITIAFTLNSWKENRTNKQVQQQYLDHITKDIEEEISNLKHINEEIETKMKLIQQFRPYLSNPKLPRDTMFRKLFDIARMVNFNPENATYLTLVNSGDLQLIDNFKLRRKIEKHYTFHATVLQEYKRLENIHSKYMGDFFIHHMDYGDIGKGDYSFMDKPVLKNILNSLEGAYHMALIGNKKCLESNKGLLNSLETRE